MTNEVKRLLYRSNRESRCQISLTNTDVFYHYPSSQFSESLLENLKKKISAFASRGSLKNKFNALTANYQ